MNMNTFVQILLLGLFYLRGTFIYANKTDNISGNATLTNNKALLQTTDTTDIANKHEKRHIYDTNGEETRIKNDSLQTVSKHSDEIIISGLDNANIENSQMTTKLGEMNSTASFQEEETTSSSINGTIRNDSFISVRNEGVSTSSTQTLSTNKGHLQDQSTATTSITKGVTLPSSNASNQHILNILNISHHFAFSKHHKVHDNIKYSPHHIPFRHHLQLVPMDDEPFGSVLLKDQRYIISVLIPIGVGIVGALVIMVTVYGLRHVAQKHGREFPRVDIEAGRQNIASISSERTDKMLLLDDDEDNEF